MKIVLRAAGVIKSGPERALIDDYLARARVLGRNLGLAFIEESAIDTRSAKTKSQETAALLSCLKAGDQLVILDERGQAINSHEIARNFSDLRDAACPRLVIAIGGADGFDLSALPSNTLKWQFGKMVWPHKLMRVMLSEQIYRALSILANTPYHRD